MLRLLKYELRKTLMSKLILLGITIVAEAVFLAGLWGNRENTLAIGAVLLFFIALTGIAIMGILSVATLHKDMNTRQGYMLFMTLGWLDFRLLLGKGANKQIWDMVQQLIEAYNSSIQLDLPHISALVFSMLASWLCTITTAYLADVVSSALLNGKKGNGIVTFLLFLVLNYVLSKLLTLVPSTLGIITVLVLQGVIALVLAAGMYVITARLMEKYLSV